MALQAAIFGVSSSLGYLLPAIIGLESMGIPSPGETALVLAAVLASQGKLHIWLVIPIGVASAIIGDNLGFVLGRRFGRDALVSTGPFHRRRERLVAMGDRFFDRHGPKAVFIGRWIAWVRFATAWLAGINGMRFRTFFAWNALGAVTWGLTYGLLGYFGGSAIISVLSSVGIAAAAVLLVAFVGVWLTVRRRERRAAREFEADTPPAEPDEAKGPTSGRTPARRS
ncbi:MAG TPA: DedA family protein [Solirubrobacteraceae bacterium]|nr:DedA family protein [Solirubrobacteraceae bacterium]